MYEYGKCFSGCVIIVLENNTCLLFLLLLQLVTKMIVITQFIFQFNCRHRNV